jgi:restriction system protein
MIIEHEFLAGHHLLSFYRKFLIMARRRKGSESNLITVLLALPWQVSAALSVIAFVVMKWIIPSLFHSVVLAPFALVVSNYSVWVSIGLLIIAAISFVKKMKPATDFYPRQPSFSYPSSPQIRTGTSSFAAIEIVKPQQVKWSIDLLRELEWNRFEVLAAEYFRGLGKRVETISHGADGGVDARIYADNSTALEYAIQCKAWNSAVGVKHVRELFGVMTHESAGKGIFMTTSTFTEDAKKFAADHSDKLFLIDGQRFIAMIEMLPDEKKAKLLAVATEGDYTTPTCASCGIKMVRRSGKVGDFWGCRNFPKCKSTLKVAV